MSTSQHSPPPAPVHAALCGALLTTVSESWEILFKCLHTPLYEISSLYHHWSATCELACTPLLTTSQKILTASSSSSPSSSSFSHPHYALNEVQDRQIFQHSPDALTLALSSNTTIPTLAASHFLRVAAQDRSKRLDVFGSLGGGVAGAKKQRLAEEERAEVMEDLRLAVYAAFLAAWMQALEAMREGEETLVEGWRDTMAWSGHVAELLSGVGAGRNAMGEERVAEEVRRVYPCLKRTVERGVRWDAHIPTLSASLEYFKYAGAKQLPTQFVSALLDYWEGQGFELKNPKEGRKDSHSNRHHYDWERLDEGNKHGYQARM